MLIGGAALAAVGSAIITDPPTSLTPPASLPPTTPPTGPPTSPVPGELPPTTNERAAETTTPGFVPADEGNAGDVALYVADVRAWTECVDKAEHTFDAIRDGTRPGFDPFDACTDRPDPRAYGFVDDNGPLDLGRNSDDPGSQRNEDPGSPAGPSARAG